MGGLLCYNFAMQSRGDHCETLLRQLELSPQVLVMAILNASPDSFYAPSRVARDDFDLSLDRSISEGADILDLGAESSRPGSSPVSPEEELARLMPLLLAARERSALPISIDTRRASVAREALMAGATMINDISAGLDDPSMVQVLKDHDCPVCIMHKQGSPAHMQDAPHYDDVVSEVEQFLLNRASYLEKSGIDPKKIVIDPGLGFGKTTGHNLQLLSAMPRLASHGYPVLLGHSRKAFIGKVIADSEANPRPVDERLPGSLAAGLLGAFWGARIIRVHDVGPSKDTLRVMAALQGARS